MSVKQKHERKILLVNPRFQFSFMSHTLLMTILVLLTVYVFKIYMLWDLKDAAINAGIPTSHEFISMIEHRSIMVDVGFIILSVLLIVFMLGWTLWVSHRVAGPIHRIRNEIKKIIDGQPLQRIGIRDHDYFHELKESVNLLIEYFRR